VPYIWDQMPHNIVARIEPAEEIQSAQHLAYLHVVGQRYDRS